MPKIIFMKYLTTYLAQIGPKSKNPEYLLKFGTCNTYSMLISILM